MDERKLKLVMGFCHSREIPYFLDHSLARHTTFQVGGSAKIFILCENMDQTLSIEHFIKDHELDFFILGGGSNLLVSDSGFEGLVIKLNYPEEIEILNQDENLIKFRVAASARCAYVAKKISAMGYKGLEFLTTIPGTIGGAIVQNAGCYGSEIKDFLKSAEISQNRKIETIISENMKFAYRHSIFKENPQCLIHYGIFRVPKGDQTEIENKINTYRENRIQSQPRNRKNAGSIFRNPPGIKAWQLIKNAGLSGKQIGDARVSEDHANFILNLGNASAMDIYQLIKTIQITVSEKFQILLEPEVILVGTF